MERRGLSALRATEVRDPHRLAVVQHREVLRRQVRDRRPILAGGHHVHVDDLDVELVREAGLLGMGCPAEEERQEDGGAFHLPPL